ncbi:MAG: hypothetical protein QOG01_3939 [Pseudonocardiales bacterium]|nr:hypothetical protein [Pseudonocardiales bacterium]
MGMPQLVVTAVLVEGRSKSEVAREYGVSRRWVITLVQRYLAEGDVGLAPRSRRPLTGPQRTTQKLEDEVIAIRKDLDKNGHEAGAATIAFHLELRHGTSPAVSTIWRIISQRGFVTRNRTSAPRAAICGSPPSNPTNVGNSTSPTGHCPTAPTWKSSTSSTITPDSASAATPCGCSKPATSTTASAKPLLVRRSGQHALRQRGRVHRPLPWRRTRRPRGHPQRPRHQFPALTPLSPTDLRQGRTVPPDPDEMARHAAQSRDPATTAEPARCLPRLLQHRPAPPRPKPAHPQQAYDARPKTVPTGTPLDDSHYRIRHDTIDPSGVFTLRHDSRLHTSASAAGTPARRHAGTPAPTSSS